MTDDQTRQRRHDAGEQSRPGKAIAGLSFTIVLLVSVACPWVMWGVWGPWHGLAGVVAGQVVYLALLKPGGICLGPAWLFTAISGLLALAGICSALLWRALH